MSKKKKDTVPTFGFLDAYKAKKAQREPARKEREAAGREALLESNK